jgi:hypothetical protein
MIFERSRRGMSGCRPFGFSGCSAPRSHVPLRSRPFAGGYDVRRHERLVALAISKLTTACFFWIFLRVGAVLHLPADQARTNGLTKCANTTPKSQTGAVALTILVFIAFEHGRSDSGPKLGPFGSSKWGDGLCPQSLRGGGGRTADARARPARADPDSPPPDGKSLGVWQ